MNIQTFKTCFTLLPVKNFHFRSPISHKNQTFLYLRNRNDLDGQGLTLWPLSGPYSHFSDPDHFPVNFHATLIMQQTFFYLWFLSFVFWFPPFFVFSLFLFPVWETENNEVWSFFSFSDLYPSVSPSWLSSVEKRASRLSLNPRLPEPRERIRLINLTSSSHFLTLWGDQQINSTSKNRVNPSTTRKVDTRHL